MFEPRLKFFKFGLRLSILTKEVYFSVPEKNVFFYFPVLHWDPVLQIQLNFLRHNTK